MIGAGGARAARAASARRQLRQQLTRLGEPPFLLLREDELAVDDDVEHAAAALHERDLDAARLADLSRQTGGSGEIASLLAVRDLHFHRALLASGVGPGEPVTRPPYRRPAARTRAVRIDRAPRAGRACAVALTAATSPLQGFA